MNCITDVKDKISKLIIKAYQNKASDLFIRENMYPYIRNNLGKIEMLEEQMAEQWGVTEELKMQDQMEWVRRMNNIGSIVDNQIYIEIITK